GQTPLLARAPGAVVCARARRTGGVGGPLLYGTLLGYAGLLAGAIYDAIFQSIVGTHVQDFGLGGEFQRMVEMLQGGPGLLVQALVGPFVLVISLFLTAGLYHLALMLLGGARRDYEATFRVCCYAKAADVVALVPMCGSVIALGWGYVLTVIGLSIVHQVSWPKALLAVLMPIIVLCCCGAGLVGLVAALAGAAARWIRTRAQTPSHAAT